MFHDIRTRLSDWLRARHAMHRLRQLDNRLLADIGIDRQDIPPLVRGDMQH